MLRAALFVALLTTVALGQVLCPHNGSYPSLVRVSTVLASLEQPCTAQCSPSNAKNLVIPSDDNTYLMDVHNGGVSGPYSLVNVEGRLVWDEPASGDAQSLLAYHINVANGGSLIVGSCSCPFQSKVLFELYGTTPDETSALGTKGIGVNDGGTLHMFGNAPVPTWTRLAKTALFNDSTITLIEAVSWQPGDLLVIYSTDYDQTQAEERNVTAVSADRKTLTLSAPLKFMHYSGLQYGIEMRGEVAILNRNIVVRGAQVDSKGKAADANAPTTGPNGLGVHMMFRMNFNEVFLQAVETYRAGQFQSLGRYPFHWHMAGDVSGRSFVRDCSCHHSFQRCYTIHATSGLVMQRNVGYRTQGHMYFLEDGNEIDNVITWNIGGYALSVPDAQSLIDSDDQAAIFWMTNPNNTVESNVAAGAAGHCFWLAPPRLPLGPSATGSYSPRRAPLGTFRWNLAHGCGQDGMHVDGGPDDSRQCAGFPQTGTPCTASCPNGCTQRQTVSGDYVNPDAPVTMPTACGATTTTNAVTKIGTGYWPTKSYLNILGLNPCNGTSPSRNAMQPAIFQSFTAWKCRNRAVWTRGSWMEFQFLRSADNAIGATMATTGCCGFVKYATFVADTPNIGNPSTSGYFCCSDPPLRSIPVGGSVNGSFAIRGWEFYDGFNQLVDSDFYGFRPRGPRRASTGAISVLRRDRFSLATSNSLTGLRFMEGTNPIDLIDYAHDGDKEMVMKDFDGSLTSRPPTGVVARTHGHQRRAAVINYRNEFHRTKSCLVNVTQKSLTCPDHFGLLQVSYSCNGGNCATGPITTIDYLAQVCRTDKPGENCYPICGGPCNAPPPSADGVTENPVTAIEYSNSLRSSVIIDKDYYYEFNTHLPDKISGNLLYSDIWKVDRPVTPPAKPVDGVDFTSAYGQSDLNEIRVAFCYPPGTTLVSVNSGYVNVFNSVSGVNKMASSFTEMVNQPVFYEYSATNNYYTLTWNRHGNNMTYFDAANGVLWFRVVVINDRPDAMSMIDAYSAGVFAAEVKLPAGYTFNPASPYKCPAAATTNRLPSAGKQCEGGTNCDMGMPPVAAVPSRSPWPAELPPLSRDEDVGIGAVCNGVAPSRSNTGTPSPSPSVGASASVGSTASATPSLSFGASPSTTPTASLSFGASPSNTPSGEPVAAPCSQDVKFTFPSSISNADVLAAASSITGLSSSAFTVRSSASTASGYEVVLAMTSTDCSAAVNSLLSSTSSSAWTTAPSSAVAQSSKRNGGGGDSSNAGLIAGAVIGSIVGVCLLLLIVAAIAGVLVWLFVFRKGADGATSLANPLYS